jgi:acetyltransferase-like isoleucine patch superfamily enzyme
MADGRQVNEPRAGVCLEPHVWVGEGVKILKDVTIGAGSIVALGSIVTRDVPRASVARGVPARWQAANGTYWSRNELQRSRTRAEHFARAFPPIED